MPRNARQQKILEIISEKEIDTQEELCEELQKLNFNVTQATVSRDIKELKLYKISGKTKKYKYSCIESNDDSVKGKMRLLFKESVQSIQCANNIVVIKTMRANGSTACLFIDSLQMKEVLGSLAGDDTIFVVSDSNENAQVIVDRLKEFL